MNSLTAGACFRMASASLSRARSLAEPGDRCALPAKLGQVDSRIGGHLSRFTPDRS